MIEQRANIQWPAGLGTSPNRGGRPGVDPGTLCAGATEKPLPRPRVQISDHGVDRAALQSHRDHRLRLNTARPCVTRRDSSHTRTDRPALKHRPRVTRPNEMATLSARSIIAPCTVGFGREVDLVADPGRGADGFLVQLFDEERAVLAARRTTKAPCAECLAIPIISAILWHTFMHALFAARCPTSSNEPESCTLLMTTTATRNRSMPVPPPSLTHIGLLTEDIEASVDRWQRLFRVRRTEARPTWFASDEGVLATYLPFPDGAVEPLQPIEAGTRQRRQLDSNRLAFHLSLRVPDIHDSVARLRRLGIWTQLRSPGRTVTVHRAWVEPSCAYGATIELIDQTEVAAFRPTEGTAQPEFDARTPRFVAVGHLVDDLAGATQLYTGLGMVSSADTDTVDVLGEKATMRVIRSTTGLALELIEEQSTTGLSQRLAMPGPGIVYLAFESPTLVELSRHLSSCEATLAEKRGPDGSLLEVWVHPDSTGGVALRIRPPRS